MEETKLATLTKKDFESDQSVRWCPGCGDFSVLSTVQKVLADLAQPREQHVFVSGIGCSSRFPYYMSTYGFHGIHGRAPAIASGVKLANPHLNVWILTGDGDALSIGGNHFIHILRRNLDVNILLFNNKIYGLTKGQYSPTSDKGQITKSSPYGVLDNPMNPAKLALGAGATFVARAVATDVKALAEVLKRAAAHKGSSFVEILQDCLVFNQNAHSYITDRTMRKERQLPLEQGQPLLFGENQDKAIVLDGLTPRVVPASEANGRAVVYDQKDVNLAKIIAELAHPEFPVPVGVMLDVAGECYDDAVYEQIKNSAPNGKKGLQELLLSNDSWQVG